MTTTSRRLAPQKKPPPQPPLPSIFSPARRNWRSWPAERLVAIWNSLPGVTPVKGFKSAKAAVGRIWEHIQKLGEPEKPKVDKLEPKAKRNAKGGAQAAKGAPVKGKAAKKATAAKKAPKAKKAAKAQETAGPREGSKTAQ